jgi:hypothetical protein
MAANLGVAHWWEAARWEATQRWAELVPGKPLLFLSTHLHSLVSLSLSLVHRSDHALAFESTDGGDLMIGPPATAVHPGAVRRRFPCKYPGHLLSPAPPRAAAAAACPCPSSRSSCTLLRLLPLRSSSHLNNLPFLRLVLSWCLFSSRRIEVRRAARSA